MSVALAWLVVVLHLVFALAESVGWSQMARRFGYSREATEHTRSLALNQGAYNAGIAVLLGWALATGRTDAAIALLAFIVAMGVVGGLSVRWTIPVVQSVPALGAIALLVAWG
ncbi:MAG: DUF1304 domain-containing protein [Alphaproteobacteria bacterium]|nr:DUF1304 domain-containing protein [Alphaproteobacteria bacterium]